MPEGKGYGKSWPHFNGVKAAEKKGTPPVKSGLPTPANPSRDTKKR